MGGDGGSLAGHWLARRFKCACMCVCVCYVCVRAHAHMRTCMHVSVCACVHVCVEGGGYIVHTRLQYTGQTVCKTGLCR